MRIRLCESLTTWLKMVTQLLHTGVREFNTKHGVRSDTAVKHERMRNLLNFRLGIWDAPTLSNRTISLGLGDGVGAQNALFSEGASRILPLYLIPVVAANMRLNWELSASGNFFRHGVKTTFAVVWLSLVTLRTLPFSMHNSHVHEEHQTSNGDKRSSPSSYTSNFGHNFHHWCKPQSMWCKSDRTEKILIS